MKIIIVVLISAFMCGCVKFGVQCTTGSTNAWVKVSRFGFGVPPKQVENMSKFKREVCP